MPIIKHIREFSHAIQAGDTATRVYTNFPSNGGGTANYIPNDVPSNILKEPYEFDSLQSSQPMIYSRVNREDVFGRLNYAQSTVYNPFAEYVVYSKTAPVAQNMVQYYRDNAKIGPKSMCVSSTNWTGRFGNGADILVEYTPIPVLEGDQALFEEAFGVPRKTADGASALEPDKAQGFGIRAINRRVNFGCKQVIDLRYFPLPADGSMSILLDSFDCYLFQPDKIYTSSLFVSMVSEDDMTVRVRFRINNAILFDKVYTLKTIALEPKLKGNMGWGTATAFQCVNSYIAFDMEPDILINPKLKRKTDPEDYEFPVNHQVQFIVPRLFEENLKDRNENFVTLSAFGQRRLFNNFFAGDFKVDYTPRVPEIRREVLAQAHFIIRRTLDNPTYNGFVGDNIKVTQKFKDNKNQIEYLVSPSLLSNPFHQPFFRIGENSWDFNTRDPSLFLVSGIYGLADSTKAQAGNVSGVINVEYQGSTGSPDRTVDIDYAGLFVTDVIIPDVVFENPREGCDDPLPPSESPIQDYNPKRLFDAVKTAFRLRGSKATPVINGVIENIRTLLANFLDKEGDGQELSTVIDANGFRVKQCSRFTTSDAVIKTT